MNLGKTIQTLRKEKNLTQNELAEKLFVSYQAISQWENGNTNPDITIIPNIADVFGITIDELFGRPKNEPVKEECTIEEINIKNFNKNALYVLLVEGNKLQKAIDYKEALRRYDDIEIKINGEVKDVYSHFSVNVDGDVKGSVTAGDGVNSGNVGGSVTAGDGVNCGNISGSVSAGDSINCGHIQGSASAGDSINCGNVDGSVSAGDSVNCCDINGNVKAEEIRCKTINAERVEAEEIYVEERLNILK